MVISKRNDYLEQIYKISAELILTKLAKTEASKKNNKSKKIDLSIIHNLKYHVHFLGLVTTHKIRLMNVNKIQFSLSNRE